ncbi:MAG: hypothetical protein NXI04_15945 [Planctomycetaceae bacterium]|nr:hypothetical protein [Planctomycetaceae bacterium]
MIAPTKLPGDELLQILKQASVRFGEITDELREDLTIGMALTAVMADDAVAQVQAMISESPEIAAVYLKQTAELAAAVRTMATVRGELKRRADNN